MDKKSLSEMFATGGVRFAIVGTLIVLSCFLVVESMTLLEGYGRTGVSATDTVTVTGSGQATLAPDVARVSFTVQNESADVATAQAATTKQANAVIDFVKGQGIADKDVKTLSYNISPQYSYPRPCVSGEVCPSYSSPKITGYQVSESIQVTVRDLTAVGTLLGGLGKLSVQNVSGPSFALDDETAGHAAARADAIVKAKAQASLLAKQLGVHLEKIVNFNESSGGYSVPMYAMSSKSEAVGMGAAPQVPIGENTYTASVSITYEIR